MVVMEDKTRPSAKLKCSNVLPVVFQTLVGALAAAADNTDVALLFRSNLAFAVRVGLSKRTSAPVVVSCAGFTGSRSMT